MDRNQPVPLNNRDYSVPLNDRDYSVSTVTLQMLNSLIDTQTRLRDAAEARWALAREALFNLARLVAADWLEQRQHEKGGLDVIRMDELSQVVYLRISSLQARALLPEAAHLQKANERNEELERKLVELEAQAQQMVLMQNNLEITNQQLKLLAEENDCLKIQIEKIRMNPQLTDKKDPGHLPAWFNDWASSRGFEKQSFALKLIGSTGICFRQDILNAMASHFNVKTDTNSIKEAFDGIIEKGFIVVSEVASGERGRPPLTASMTPLGESAYIYLIGDLPKTSKFDEIRQYHSTDEHTILVLKAAQILEKAGYEIISKGEINIPIDDHHLSSPDILARKYGQDIHVEVERDVNKGNSLARERKWQNAFEAGRGTIYVICQTINLQKELIQEINHALAAESRLGRASIFMTNLDELAAGLKHKDGSIWLSQKVPSKPVN